MAILASEDLLPRRLASQRVLGQPFDTPEDVVSWLGAVQAQDFAGAKWALAQRTARATDADVEDAFARGAILRTHVMRPTWHFVMPADIRWLLTLTSPRVNALSATYHRKLALDEPLFRRSRSLLEKTLRDGRQLTRAELASVFRKAGIASAEDPLRMGFLMMRAELDGVICSGPRRGKQFTYALLEERVPPARPLAREEALAELVRRYFVSHGPATVKDFAWWSGLTMADGAKGLALVESSLASQAIDGRTYWAAPGARPRGSTADMAHLLPAYDEALLSYRDNRVSLAPYGPQLTRDNGQTIVINGRAAGTWKRTIAKGAAVIDAFPFAPLKRREKAALAAAAERYGRFLNGPAVSVRYP